GPNSGSTRSATPGFAGPTAATTWRQNRTGSLSPASSDSQATGRPLRRAQSASTTVLPYPAGAHTSTSPRASPSSSRPARRGPARGGKKPPAAAGAGQAGGPEPHRPGKRHPPPGPPQAAQPSATYSTARPAMASADAGPAHVTAGQAAPFVPADRHQRFY